MKHKEVTAEVQVSRVIDHYWRPFLVVLAIAIFSFASYTGYQYFVERTELKAQEELYVLQKAVDKKSSELPKEIIKNPEALNKEFSNSLNQYNAFIEKHKGLKAAKMAAIQKAELAGSFQDWGLAENTLASVVGATGSSDLFFGLVRSQLAMVYFNQNKFKEAIVLLEEIVNNKSQAYLHPHSLVRLGAGYLEMGDNDKARATFKRVEADFSQTQAAREAKNFQKLISNN